MKLEKGRRWAVKIFIGFVAAMVVCTILSRAADSVLVAQVKIEKAGRGRLSYTYEGTGDIVPKKEEKIFLWEGQQIEWTAVKGSEVKKGECLVRFRKEYLEREIEKKRSELTQLKLQEKGQQISARKPARVPVSKSAYQALLEAEKKLETAKSNEKKARTLWETYKKKETGGVKPDAEKKNDTLKEQELEEAYLAAKAQTEALRQERTQALSAYDLAKKEDAAQEKNSADAQEAAKTNAQAASEQVKTAEKELKILKGYKKAGGKILAEQDCKVLENSVQTGIVTTGTEYISIGNGGWKLRGEIRKEDENKVRMGTKVMAQFAFGGKTQTKIESVETEAGRTDEEGELQSRLFWYAALPEEYKAEEAGTFTWKTQVESEEEYDQVIPMSALREDVEGAYCLIITETEQMLGTLKTAKRVPVNVLEKDGKKAAITSELRKEDQIIIFSEKFVAGGDRVRISE